MEIGSFTVQTKTCLPEDWMRRISPGVAGPLTRIHANSGDRVKQGDLLLELDDRDYQHQVKVMESKLASAQANLLKMKIGARPR